MGGTWDIFRYPGVRSDSDMYTLGFGFRPWRNPKSIAPGEEILGYLQETAAEFGFRDKIKLRHRLVTADWSSLSNQWTLTLSTPTRSQRRTCRFLFMATGYYDVDKGYTPSFPGIDKFAGQVVHPQQWPGGLDSLPHACFAAILLADSSCCGLPVYPAALLCLPINRGSRLLRQARGDHRLWRHGGHPRAVALLQRRGRHGPAAQPDVPFKRRAINTVYPTNKSRCNKLGLTYV